MNGRSLLEVPQIAEKTGKPMDTIRSYRHRQTAGHDEGPRMFKLGRRVVAFESDVDALDPATVRSRPHSRPRRCRLRARG